VVLRFDYVDYDARQINAESPWVSTVRISFHAAMEAFLVAVFQSHHTKVSYRSDGFHGHWGRGRED
jgi:hypothetical protein